MFAQALHNLYRIYTVCTGSTLFVQVSVLVNRAEMGVLRGKDFQNLSERER